MLLDWESPMVSICPGCSVEFPSNDPRPGCHECECCFCSTPCRAAYHRAQKLDHDFNKPLSE